MASLGLAFFQFLRQSLLIILTEIIKRAIFVEEYHTTVSLNKISEKKYQKSVTDPTYLYREPLTLLENNKYYFQKR